MSVDASTVTFANLQAGGITGALPVVVAASTALSAAAAAALSRIQGGDFLGRARGLLDSYVRGDPTVTSNIAAALQAESDALAVVQALLAQTASLVTSNPGTLGPVADHSPGGTSIRRTFP